MKPFWLLLGLLAPVSVFGQSTGTVVFANTAQTLFTTNGSTLGQGSGNMNAGGNTFRIGLYIAPDGTTLESAFTLVAVATNSSIQQGRFNFSGNPFNPPGNTGQPIAFLVKAWPLSFGSSFEEAYLSTCTSNGFPAKTFYGGRSPIGRVTPATGSNPAPTLFGTGEFPGQLTSGIVLVPYAISPCLYCTLAITATKAGSNVTFRIAGSRAQDSECTYYYKLQAASSVTGPWTNLNGVFRVGASGVLELTDTNPPTPRFYRVFSH